MSDEYHKPGAGTAMTCIQHERQIAVLETEVKGIKESIKEMMQLLNSINDNTHKSSSRLLQTEKDIEGLAEQLTPVVEAMVTIKSDKNANIKVLSMVGLVISFISPLIYIVAELVIGKFVGQ